MAIERGTDWGHAGTMPSTVPAAESDAEIARLVGDGATQVRPLAGDLARTLGVTAQSLLRPVATILPCDLIAVTLDGQPDQLAAAHVVINAPVLPDVCVMNAAFIGALNMAPKAHPGDGRVDVLTLQLGLVDRFKARRRAVTGSHLPHPHINVRRHVVWEQEFSQRRRVRIDGRPAGTAQTVRCRVIPEGVQLGV